MYYSRDPTRQDSLNPKFNPGPSHVMSEVDFSQRPDSRAAHEVDHTRQTIHTIIPSIPDHTRPHTSNTPQTVVSQSATHSVTQSVWSTGAAGEDTGMDG